MFELAANHVQIRSAYGTDFDAHNQLSCIRLLVGALDKLKWPANFFKDRCSNDGSICKYRERVALAVSTRQ